ncbi:MAG: YicC/YloC family endoribonuclease [Rhizomicrobium sp.]
MSIISMTGFAESHGTQGALSWRWEIKSVNGRGLDIRLRTPPGFDSIEPAARLLAAERFKRGNLQATLTLDTQDSGRGFKVDPVALAAAIRIAQELCDQHGLAPARVDGLLALKGVIIVDELANGPEERAARDAVVLESLAVALDSLRRSRRAEGTKLAKLLAGMLNEIEQLTTKASGLASATPEALRARLSSQLGELLADTAISEERLAQEAAMLAVRADIREELDRLNAHVSEARRLLAAGEAIGRQLDFLSQEFNREANTLCSKSADIEMTRTGLALKAVIDQLREQAQNVE